MKMERLLLTFIFASQLHMSSSYAQMTFAEEVVCTDEAEFYGNGEGKDELNLSCIDLIKKNAVLSARVESTKLKIKFYGHKNIIVADRVFTKKIDDKEVTKNITDVIAGSSTELKSVKAMVIDEVNEELVVLDKSGDIYFFTSKFSGNIAPLRILKNREIVDAESVSINSEKNEVIVNIPKRKKRFIFSRLANVNAPKDKQKLEVLRKEDL
jgi:hypothetical protein